MCHHWDRWFQQDTEGTRYARIIALDSVVFAFVFQFVCQCRVLRCLRPRLCWRIPDCVPSTEATTKSGIAERPTGPGTHHRNDALYKVESKITVWQPTKMFLTIREQQEHKGSCRDRTMRNAEILGPSHWALKKYQQTRSGYALID